MKRRQAEILFDARDLVVSTQVLGEFNLQATWATRNARLTHHQASTIVTSMERYPIQTLTYAIVLNALEICDHHQISYWDAAILSAAQASSCEQVLSEDLSAGHRYSGVVVVNPFAG